MLLPWLTLLWGLTERDQRHLRALTLCAATCASALLLFAPVLYTYGLSFFSFYDRAVDDGHLIARRATTGVWGTLGVFAWCGTLALALLARTTITASLRSPKTRCIVLAASMAVAVYAAPFCDCLTRRAT